jgi:hypothetical protein
LPLYMFATGFYGDDHDRDQGSQNATSGLNLSSTGASWPWPLVLP